MALSRRKFAETEYDITQESDRMQEFYESSKNSDGS